MKIKYYLLLVTLSLLIFAQSCKDDATSPDKSVSISGFVNDAIGNPIDSALVEIIDENVAVLQSTFTNTEGNFLFNSVSGDLMTMKLRVSAVGYSTILLSPENFLKDSKPQSVLINMSKLQEDNGCCEVIKILVRKYGTDVPLSNAEIRLTKNNDLIGTGKSDEDGYLAFQKICEGKYLIRIALDGYNVIEEYKEIGDCDTVTYEFGLKEKDNNDCCKNIYKVVIKDENGTPIKGARLLLRVNGVVKYEGTANENGLAAIDGICKGDYSVLVKYEGYVSQEFEVGFDCAQTKDKAITLKKTESDCCKNIYKVVIKDENGTPIKGARLLLRVNGVVKYEGTANENGLAAIDGICKGDYSVLVKYEGYVSQEFGVGFDCAQTKDKAITLKKTESDCCKNIYKVVIKDENGTPIKGARLLLRVNGVVKYEGTANENGLAAIDGICKGDYSVLVKYEGYVSQEYSVGFDCAQTKDKAITLKKSETDCCNNVYKVVIKDESGNPVKGARLLLRVNGVVKYEGTANENGLATIDGICKGEYSVLVKYEGYISQEYSVGFDCAQTKDKAITLKKSETDCCNNVYKVVIKDENGTPIKGARLLLRVNGVVKYEGTANADGLAAIDNICKGDYSVLVKYEGYISQEYSVGFDCAQTKDKAITLKKSETDCCNNVYKVVIKDENGTPIKGARLLLRVNGVVKYEGTANADGLAAIDNICKGDYSVLVKYEGYVSQEFSVGFDCAQAKEKTVVLKKI